jgi:hypothetical protein
MAIVVCARNFAFIPSNAQRRAFEGNKAVAAGKKKLNSRNPHQENMSEKKFT